jgi:hypothetical protein
MFFNYLGVENTEDEDIQYCVPTFEYKATVMCKTRPSTLVVLYSKNRFLVNYILLWPCVHVSDTICYIGFLYMYIFEIVISVKPFNDSFLATFITKF